MGLDALRRLCQEGGLLGQSSLRSVRKMDDGRHCASSLRFLNQKAHQADRSQPASRLLFPISSPTRHGAYPPAFSPPTPHHTSLRAKQGQPEDHKGAFSLSQTIQPVGFALLSDPQSASCSHLLHLASPRLQHHLCFPSSHITSPIVSSFSAVIIAVHLPVARLNKVPFARRSGNALTCHVFVHSFLVSR